MPERDVIASHRPRLFAAAVLAIAVFSTNSIASDEAPTSQLADDLAQLADLQSRFERIARRVARSVVSISAAVNSVEADDALRSDDLTGQKLDKLLEHAVRSVGTGFVLDRDGYIVTNEHVIADAQQIWVTTDDRKVFPAFVVGSDPRADLAVLKIPADQLQPAAFAPSESIQRGMWTLSLGNPYGLAGAGEMALSVGVVSATDRSLTKLSSRENRLYNHLIQTTAQINPGNSGGPLFDLNGNVIGITTAVVMPQKQINGIGFAMPLDSALKEKIQQLRAGREIVYAYLGVSVANLTPRQRREANLLDDTGVLIESVEPESPASAAPLRGGDILVSIGHDTISDSDQFVRVIGAVTIDKPTTATIIRDGKPIAIDVTLRRRAMPSVAVTRQNQRLQWRGLLLGPIPENWTRGGKAASTGVVVISVAPDSPLKTQSIAPGSILNTVAGKSVSDLASLQRIINDMTDAQCSIKFDAPGGDVALTETGE